MLRAVKIPGLPQRSECASGNELHRRNNNTAGVWILEETCSRRGIELGNARTISKTNASVTRVNACGVTALGHWKRENTTISYRRAPNVAGSHCRLGPICDPSPVCEKVCRVYNSIGDFLQRLQPSQHGRTGTKKRLLFRPSCMYVLALRTVFSTPPSSIHLARKLLPNHTTDTPAALVSLSRTVV